MTRPRWTGSVLLACVAVAITAACGSSATRTPRGTMPAQARVPRAEPRPLELVEMAPPGAVVLAHGRVPAIAQALARLGVPPADSPSDDRLRGLLLGLMGIPPGTDGVVSEAVLAVYEPHDDQRVPVLVLMSGPLDRAGLSRSLEQEPGMWRMLAQLMGLSASWITDSVLAIGDWRLVTAAGAVARGRTTPGNAELLATLREHDSPSAAAAGAVRFTPLMRAELGRGAERQRPGSAALLSAIMGLAGRVELVDGMLVVIDIMTDSPGSASLLDVAFAAALPELAQDRTLRWLGLDELLARTHLSPVASRARLSLELDQTQLTTSWRRLTNPGPPPWLVPQPAPPVPGPPPIP